MATFDDAIGFVLENEGGWVYDKNDPGGETKYGISKRQYPNLDIKSLTVAQAEQIYQRDYWNILWASIDTQDIATKLLDMAVNMGPKEAVMLVQRAAGVEADGIFGQKTLDAINEKSPGNFLQEIRARQAVFYAEVAEHSPIQRAFLLSWMRRAVK